MKAKTIFAALLVVASAAVADDYQFIVSGYPAANVSIGFRLVCTAGLK